MGSLIPSELSPDCSFNTSLRASPIAEMIAEFRRIYGASETIQKLDDLAGRLEAEMKKIDAFKRELPLCMDVLSDAIVTVKEAINQCKKSNVLPVFEEFIPLKKTNYEKDEYIKCSGEEIDKMNWISSVQLWNSDNQHKDSEQEIKLDNSRTTEDENNQHLIKDLFPRGGKKDVKTAFLPFKGCNPFSIQKVVRDASILVPEISFGSQEIKNLREEMNSSDFSTKSSGSRSGSNSAANDHSKSRGGQQSQHPGRKQRRCWSPELHRRFVGALEQLGGAQVATPKQIRELMQVDGLSNDEVKSHLQKYRIHTRRVSPTTINSQNQPVVLGGVWMYQEQSVGSSKQRNSQSGSPLGPLHLEEDEDEDDGKSSGTRNWKCDIQLSMRNAA